MENLRPGYEWLVECCQIDGKHLADWSPKCTTPVINEELMELRPVSNVVEEIQVIFMMKKHIKPLLQFCSMFLIHPTLVFGPCLTGALANPSGLFSIASIDLANKNPPSTCRPSRTLVSYSWVWTDIDSNFPKVHLAAPCKIDDSQ